MKKPIYGQPLYFASDKNVFDALTEHKVDAETVFRLFQSRNTIVSQATSRDELARYFARLIHDLYDHQIISARLGIVPRRERLTSLDLQGVSNVESVEAAIASVKKELESTGDVVHVKRKDDNWTVEVQYTNIDYGRTELAQVQIRDGTVEFIKTPDGYTVRNNQNDVINGIRDSVIANIEKSTAGKLEKRVVSMFDIPISKFRTKFFTKLMNEIPGFKRLDVSTVFVYKPRPLNAEGTTASVDDDPDAHIERVFLRGNGVTQSELLDDLVGREDYYIFKAGWTISRTISTGTVFDLEAVFADPKDCTEFSFILAGVIPVESGVLSKTRRTPSKDEVDQISRVIEAHSRQVLADIRNEYAQDLPKGPQ